ncbi:FAD-dependent oxidoreductase [Streptomyces sp. NBC_00555]|uniref:FAD-dependent oxidoreductase n=1 Tax=unclassified Streptomyces TaxID=2593676 RepID=UPI00214B5FFA|nr:MULTISPECIES: FAD-dependent oxidoreductase [unclassified Streptomyces]MCX5014925.1 FAD-dependent oxidoreductase [Streptomyces sp. NBC_00555]UUU37809.1 FAD-dependent oxidoreductase [Streptomyces sp. NBC_00162]
MYDVVIVGAGPVGLFLACELGLAGCSVLVREKEPEPDSRWRAQPFERRGLFGFSTGAFYRRGLLDALRETSADMAGHGAPAVAAADGTSRPLAVGHFAGVMLDPAKVDLAALPYRLPSPAPDTLMIRLPEVESLLAERAVKLGVEIRRGAPVDAVVQHDEHVVVSAGADAVEARWVVGCDGGRSAVRRLAGFEFTGTEPEFTGYTMVATLADPEKLRPGINATPTGMYLRLGVDGTLGMMDFDGGAFDRSRQPTRDHLQAVLRRVSGTDVTLTDVRRVSTFTDRAKQTTTYREGRILLAGDAAHIHSPLGGQGLNTGIGDAVNLGWKLAATVRGHAPDGLLDTYDEERRPVGAQVLDWSRAQVAVMRPNRGTWATRGVVRDLLGTRDGTTYVFEKMSGSSMRYDLGGAHPLVGRNAPDFLLEDGASLGELMRDGLGVVLDFTAERRLAGPASAWRDRVRYAAGTPVDGLGLEAVLIRPDGTVAWAEGDDAADAGFEEAASRWFGRPTA